MTQMVKSLSAMWETWVRFLGGKDLLEEGMPTHSRILALRLLMDRGAWWAIVHGVTESNTTKRLSTTQHKSLQNWKTFAMNTWGKAIIIPNLLIRKPHII